MTVVMVQGGGILLREADRGSTLQLSIRSITPSSAGTYTCKAWNKYGRDEDSSTLVVQCTLSNASSSSAS